MKTEVAVTNVSLRDVGSLWHYTTLCLVSYVQSVTSLWKNWVVLEVYKERIEHEMREGTPCLKINKSGLAMCKRWQQQQGARSACMKGTLVSFLSRQQTWCFHSPQSESTQCLLPPTSAITQWPYAHKHVLTTIRDVRDGQRALKKLCLAWRRWQLPGAVLLCQTSLLCR